MQSVDHSQQRWPVLFDRGLAPDEGGHHFCGVSAQMLVGKPAMGGFGAMSWREHILARHAWWGARFVSAPADTAEPWFLLGRAILRSHDMSCGPLACLDYPTHQRAPAALHRMLSGLQALGRVSVVGVPVSPEFTVPLAGGALVSPGSWCVDALLWGNLFAPTPPPAAATTAGPRGLQILPRGRFVSASGRSAFNAGGFVRSALLTVGDAMRAVRAIRPLATRDPYQGPWADADSELADLEDVLSALPQGWRAAAVAVTLPAPGALEVFLQSDGLTPACFSRAVTLRELKVECGLVTGLGWHLGRRTVRVAELSVRVATAMQMGPLLKRGRNIVETLWTLLPPWVCVVTRMLWPPVVSRWLQRSASFGSYGGTTTIRKFIGGSLSMVWQQQSACTCKIVVVSVALWLVVRLADTTTSGSVLLPRQLWRSCNIKSQADILVPFSLSMSCACCARGQGSRVHAPCMRVCGGWCAFQPSMLWMWAGRRPLRLVWSSGSRQH
jgi:hypothetical protein